MIQIDPKAYELIQQEIANVIRSETKSPNEAAMIGSCVIIVLGRVPPRGVGAVGNSPAGATVQSLAQAGELSTAAVIAGLR
jgi:hypothetical protein